MNETTFPTQTDPVPLSAGTPGLEAGSTRRRMATWMPTDLHINALLQNAGPNILARARWLVRNNGYAKAALRAWATASVGPGIRPSPIIPDPAIKAAVALAWADWCDVADQEEVTDFYGISRRVSREVFLGGECFVRLLDTEPGEAADVPLQLQVMPSEQLPLWRQVVAGNGNPVRLGIEFDRVSGQRVAYWFWKFNPTDNLMTWDSAIAWNALVRIPADQILHVYDPVEAGQIRGLTGYAAAIVKLFMLDVYDDAELERKKQAARFATFVTKPVADMSDPNLAFEAAAGEDPLPAYYGPGAFMELNQGEDVKFSEPADVGPNYEAFQYRTLLQAASACGVPYAELTGDLSKATYASSRAGLLAFRGEIDAFQWSVLVHQFLRPVYRLWLRKAVIAGAVPISATQFAQRPQAWSRFRAITPKAPWVDPMKDVQAAALSVMNGFAARSDIIEAEGYDPEETDARIAADHAREEALGLNFVPTTAVAKAPKEYISPEGDNPLGETPQPDPQRNAA